MIIIYESYVCIWSWSSYTSLSYHCPTLMYLATTCHKKTNRHGIKMNQADMIFEVYYNPKATCTTPPSVFTPPKSFQHVTRKAGSITDQVKPSALANKALVGPCSFPYASHLLSLEVPTWIQSILPSRALYSKHCPSCCVSHGSPMPTIAGLTCSAVWHRL